MVAYVFFRREVAIPRFEALKEKASRWAENFGLKEQDWWSETVANCVRRWIVAGHEVPRTPKSRGDDITFAFAKAEKGCDAAHMFVVECSFRGIRGWIRSPEN
jgi:hypothetical protein